MAITRQKKESVVARIGEMLDSSKLMVLSHYTGLSVSDMQELRRQARDNGVQVTVAKNRLVKLAIKNNAKFAQADTSFLSGQIALAIADDDVAPAQLIANFSKSHPAMEIVGGLTADGNFLNVDEVKVLASLPSREVLRGQLVGVIAAPISGFVNVLSGNIRGLVNVINARAEALQ